MQLRVHVTVFHSSQHKESMGPAVVLQALFNPKTSILFQKHLLQLRHVSSAVETEAQCPH